MPEVEGFDARTYKSISRLLTNFRLWRRDHPTPRQWIVVVAGNYTQYTHWCRKYGFNPHDPSLVHVGRPERLRGLNNVAAFFFIGDHHLWGGERNWEARSELWYNIQRIRVMGKDSRGYEAPIYWEERP